MIGPLCNNLRSYSGATNEGLTPWNCALSLVGEPIMYPEINALVDDLHKSRISTFLVTNAEFPDKTKPVKPLTQVVSGELLTAQITWLLHLRGPSNEAEEGGFDPEQLRYRIERRHHDLWR